MDVLNYVDAVNQFAESGDEGPVDALRRAAGDHVVDLGWHTDEELLYVHPFYREDPVFGAPVASQLDETSLSASMATALRMMSVRGDVTSSDDGEVLLLNSLGAIANILRASTRQTTIEARRSGATRRLILRRSGDLCMVEEVVEDGLHHVMLMKRSAEVELVLSIVSVDADWTSTGEDSVEAALNDETLQARIQAASSNASTSTLLSRVTVATDEVSEVPYPVMMATLYSGGRGLEIFGGSPEQARIAHVALKDAKETLHELLG